MEQANAITTRGNAFTLIELLVVISLLSLLVAILLPVFAGVRERGRRAICQSNLKQVAGAVMQYAQDYDSKFPRCNSLGGTYTFDLPFSMPRGWAAEIYPYSKSTQVYQCPSELSPGAQAPGVAGNSGFTDYFFNANLNTSAGSPGEDGISETLLQAPAYTVLLGESGWSGSDNLSSNGCNIDVAGLPAPCTPGSGAAAAFSFGGFSDVGFTPYVLTAGTIRHLGGSNYAFADGHVKWFVGRSYLNSDGQIAGTTPTVYDARVPAEVGSATFGR